MFGKRHPEVLVVGAGPVGLFTALSLIRRGIPVQIVDEEWRTGAHSYALSLHAESLRLLERADLLEETVERAYRIRQIGVYEGANKRTTLNTTDLPGGPGYLAVMPQDTLEGLLEDALARAGVHVQWNHRVSRLHQTSEGVTTTIDRLEQESLGYSIAHTEWIVSRSRDNDFGYVVGADGHLSDTRRFLGIPFEEVAPAQHFAVFEFQTDQNLNQEMSIVVDRGTTSVLWPLPGGYCRWSFELSDFQAPAYSRRKDRITAQMGAALLPVLDDSRLYEFLERRAPWFHGSIDDVRWRLVVRFERRMVPRYGTNRVWLTGDAAHMTAPGGIQSMNVGLREADDLARTIVDRLHDRTDHEAFERYSDRWLAEWRHLHGIDALVLPRGIDPWLKQHASTILSNLPASGPDLQEFATQLGMLETEAA